MLGVSADVLRNPPRSARLSDICVTRDRCDPYKQEPFAQGLLRTIRWQTQLTGPLPQKERTCLMVRVVADRGGDQRAGIDENHYRPNSARRISSLRSARSGSTLSKLPMNASHSASLADS
jgi:hypothetical protein